MRSKPRRKFVAVRVNQDEESLLRTMAKTEGITLSAAIRACVAKQAVTSLLERRETHDESLEN
jgi:hypothetical protein